MEINDEIEIEENNILDDSWINTFNKEDNLYKEFYKDDLFYINMHFIYVDNLNNIKKIKKTKFLMIKPNYISREEIIGLLKRNSIINNKKYTLLSMLKYNITLDIEDINYFLNTNNKYNFLNPLNNIDAIKFDKTINTFQDLNDLIFIFYEKENVNEKENKTKKIYLHNKNKKTIRNKIYK